jgi:hypothetical protein
MKLGLHFNSLSLSLTLNNASTSLDGNGYVRTLNLKLSQTGRKFYEKTYLVIQNKK